MASDYIEQGHLKRSLDVTVASILGIIFSPVVAAEAVAIKLGDGGKVFYTEDRLGRGGEFFKLIKFRSMIADAASHEPEFVGHIDKRATPVGRILRSSSIDELPELAQVMRGTMSMVGPRARNIRELERMRVADACLFDDWWDGSEVTLPAISGPGQFILKRRPIHDRQVLIDSMRADMGYMDTATFGTDISVLIRTPLYMLERAAKTPVQHAPVCLDNFQEAV